MSPAVYLLPATLALYLGATVLLAANVLLRRSGLVLGGRLAAVAGAVVHAALIGARCVELRHTPFASPGEALSALAWMIVLVYLASELVWRLAAAGPAALGLSFLLAMWAELLPRAGSGPVPAALSTGIISLHITAILASFGAFALAFCCAALYLLQYHILKSKHGLAWLKRLPPLVTLEQAAFALVAFGFPLLTLGILAGMLNAQANPVPGGWHGRSFLLLAYAVWGVYGVYLLARLRAQWTPVRTSYVLLVGLALCLLLSSATQRPG